MTALLPIRNLSKTFMLHARAELSSVNMYARAGECVALDGPSGAGKARC